MLCLHEMFGKDPKSSVIHFGKCVEFSLMLIWKGTISSLRCKMKTQTKLVALCLAVVVSLSLGQSVLASQVSSSVTLSYLKVQLTYPQEVLPGDSLTVNVQATAKEYLRLVSLSVQIYYGDSGDLHLLTSATIAKDMYMSTRDRINKDIQITVPLDAPRTSLIALVSENVRSRYYDYSYYYYPYYYYPYFYNYSYPYYYAVYPSYTYASTTDDTVTALSYIKATTPEYVALQTEYQTLQQKLTQAQSDNQKLQQDLQAKQVTINQMNSAVSDLNQLLAAAQSNIQLLQMIAVVLTGIIVFLTAFLWREKTKHSTEATDKEKS